jgi:hypothetical protein
MSLKGISISFFQFFFRLFLGFSPAFPKFFAGFPSGSAEENRSLSLDSGRIRLCEALSGLKQPYSEEALKKTVRFPLTRVASGSARHFRD